jgi:hypothetical protein
MSRCGSQISPSESSVCRAGAQQMTAPSFGYPLTATSMAWRSRPWSCQDCAPSPWLRIPVIVITQTGDRDHAAHVGRGVPSVQHRVALVVTTDGCSVPFLPVFVKRHARDSLKFLAVPGGGAGDASASAPSTRRKQPRRLRRLWLGGGDRAAGRHKAMCRDCRKEFNERSDGVARAASRARCRTAAGGIAGWLARLP